MAMTHWRSRGMFFTISALILLSVLFVSLMFQSRYTYSERNRIVTVKTSALQNYAAGLEQDTQRGLYIAGFRAVLGAEEAVLDRNSFLNDSRRSISEAMMNGTISGVPVSTMNQSTLPGWLSNTQAQIAKLGLLLNMSFDQVSVNQSSPWSVDFLINVSYNVTDRSGTAVIARTGAVTSSVSILGFNDPLFVVLTSNRIRPINITPYEGNYTSGLNTANLIQHINSSYYAVSSGPSFLMRLQGDLGNSPDGTGIESIVKIPDLAAQGMVVYVRSDVDYVYFGNTTPPIFSINNTYPDWFRLDEGHLGKYQVTDLKI